MRRRTAFSLIELLVAMAVLALLLVLLSSLFGGISSAWYHSKEKLDNFARGRALLGTIERDVRNAVIRQDLPIFPAVQINGKAGLAFFTKAYGQDTDTGNMRPLNYVTYFQGTNQTISRRDRPFGYDSTALSWNPFDTNAALSLDGDTTVKDRELCPGILAFNFRFLQSDGSVTDAYAGVPLKASDPSLLDPAKAHTVAVRLSMVIISDQAQTTLQRLGKDTAFAALLQSKIAGQAGSAKLIWDRLLQGDSDLVALNLPAVVLNGIRTYEEVVTLESSPAYVTR